MNTRGNRNIEKTNIEVILAQIHVLALPVNLFLLSNDGEAILRCLFPFRIQLAKLRYE